MAASAAACIAVLAYDAQVRLALAALAHRAPRGRLVVDDDDVHQGGSAGARGAAPGPSRSSGIWISASHSRSSAGPA